MSESAASTAAAETSPVLLFDGECVMCNSTVHFVANRDVSGRVRFASLQSRFADSVAAQHGTAFPRDLSTVVLLDRERHVWFIKSDAALRTAALLAWPWNWIGATLLCVVPRCVRDAVYDVVARNRYRWFGKHEHVSGDRNTLFSWLNVLLRKQKTHNRRTVNRVDSVQLYERERLTMQHITRGEIKHRVFFCVFFASVQRCRW
jgi:predicted DCC family thiol-disulfide oxidoreductase YuxK